MSKSIIDISNTPITLCKTFDEISMWREANLRVDQNSGNNFKGILSDIYSEPTHFMFELLQNADDANATKVRFEIKNNKIIFAHNGTRDFSLEDIISITGIGNSTKGKSNQSIGKFGVGFKAVFAITKTPKIWSNTYNFKIENLTVPYKIDPLELGEWSTIFELEFASDKYDADEIHQRVIREADSLDIQTILFMRQIRQLEILTDNKRTIALDHSQLDGYSEFSDPIDGSKYLVFCGGKNDRTSVSYKLDADGNITKPVNTNVSVFFPTRINSLLGFVINAPFNTPRTRETIDFTDSYNPILVKETKVVFSRSVLKLRDLGLWTPEMIQDTMPINNELREQSKMYDYLFEALIETFMKEKLLPTLENKYQLVDKTAIAADSTISKLLVNHDKDWAQVSNEDVLLKNYLNDTLGVPTVYFRDFVQLCSPSYLKRQKASWLYMFYSYCSKHLDNGYSAEYLRQQPILMSRAGTFVAAYIGDSQNIFLYSKGLDESRIIDKMFTTKSSEVAEDIRQNLVKLLDKLEVKSRSPKSTIELDYMHRWDTSDFDTRKKLFFSIVDIYNESNNDEKDEITKYLSDKEIIYTGENQWLSEGVYQDTANLRLLFDGEYKANYIHPDFWVIDYHEHEIVNKDGSNRLIKKCRGSNELLEALGVCSGFRVTRGEYGMFPYRFANSGNLFKKYGVPIVGGNIRVEFTYEISDFEEVLNNIDTPEKSSVLVTELLAIPDDKYKGEVGWYTSTRASRRESTYSVPSQFILQLNNSKWIYVNGDNCHSPSEIFKDDFIGLYGIKKNEKLLELIDFKPSFRKSLPPEDLEKLELADKLTIEELKESIRQKEALINNASEEITIEDSTRTIAIDETKEIVMTEQQSVGSQVQFNEEVHDYDETDKSEPKVRKRVEKVAVKTTDNTKQQLGDYGEIKVLEYLKSQHKKAVDITGGFMVDGKKFLLLGKTNPGYDIEVSEDDEIIEYIEVKVRTAESGSVIITHTEWEYAKKFGNKYTIYIVSGINDDNAVLKLQRYNDPFRLSTEGSIFLTPDSYRLS
jgi:hypothetical protein